MDASKGDNKALKVDQEALKDDEEALNGDGEPLVGEGEALKRTSMHSQWRGIKQLFNCKMRIPGTVKCRPAVAY